jgi:uncharacterized membrane protein
MDELLRQLKQKTNSLQVLSMIFICSLAFLFFTSGFVFVGNTRDLIFYEIGWITFGFGLVILLVREQVRKDGESLFEEISDELQWDVKGQVMTGSSADLTRPNVNSRYALRRFAKTSDLPFGLSAMHYLALQALGMVLLAVSMRY